MNDMARFEQQDSVMNRHPLAPRLPVNYSSIIKPAIAKFGGLDIFVHPDFPKMKLSLDCPVTQEFREETDRWMLGFFGTANMMSDGEVTAVGNNLHMNPRTFAEFKNACNNEKSFGGFKDSAVMHHHV